MTASTPASLAGLPDWARQLSEKYYSRTLAMFVLHGNVRDLVPMRRSNATEFVPLQRFLREQMFGRRDLMLSYDRGGGISFGNSEAQADFSRALQGYDTFHGTSFSKGLPRNTDGVLNILDNYLRLRILDRKSVALVIDFAETSLAGAMVSAKSITSATLLRSRIRRRR